MKLHSNLWIKASGTWLIHADRDDIFLPVSLTAIRACIDREEEYSTEYNGLRPSVETAMHAVLPQLCVVHVHSVNTLAWAVLGDSPRSLSAQLDGLNWVWIPWVYPGLPLALAIRNTLDSSPDVIVMQNHGLIVAGDTCESAEALLRHVERRLHLPLKINPPVQIDRLRDIAGSDWSLPDDEEVHGLGTDPDSFRIATEGTLYPDHCVYLGHAVAPCYSGESVAQAASRYEQAWSKRPTVLACEGLGVLTAPDLSRASREMLTCISSVVRRIPCDSEVNYLADDQVQRLMNWDAEHYRQAVARQMERQ